MTHRSARLMAGMRQLLLTAGAVVGLLCILVTVAALLFGVRPLVFRSGSMSPTIGTGALAISHEVSASDLQRGDVVSVPTPAGARVTHRIHSVEHLDGEAILELKGDANEAVDATPYRVTHADVVLFHVPWVGYAVGWLTSPAGLVLLGLYAAFLLSVLLRGRVEVGPGPDDERSPPRRRGGRRRKPTPRGRAVRASVTTSLVVATLASGLVLQHRSSLTLAAWTDAPTVSGTTQTAYTVPAPNGNDCAPYEPGTKSQRGVEITWPANVAPLPLLSYPSPIVSGLSSPTISGVTDVTVGSVASKRFQVFYDPGQENRNKLVTVTVTPRLAGTPSWTGPMTTWKFRTGNQNDQPVCGNATPAVVAIRAPQDGTTQTPTQLRTFLGSAAGCTTPIAFCGTLEDASTISSVRYVLKRVQGSTTTCFNGNGWVAACTPVTAASTTYQNQLTFYDPATPTTVYPNSGTGTYTLTVTVTDNWENVTTTSVSFTLS